MVGIVIPYTTVASFLQQWEFVLSNFQVDTIYVVGGSFLESTLLSSSVCITDSADLPNDTPIVVLAPQNGENVQGNESLVDFTHPTDVIYWFGSDSAHLKSELFEKREPDHKVYIPTDTIDQMYSFSSYAVVAWDRRSKK